MKQVFKIVYDALITNHIIRNQAELIEIIGYSKTYISQLVSGKKAISEKLVHKISQGLPMVNVNFLRTGEGEPILSQPLICSHKNGNIRYWVDIDATGGGIVSFDDMNNYKSIDLQIPEFRDCTDAVNLYGDSMIPRYKPGQIIIIKEWTESFIEYGYVYLIITKNGHRMVKQLKKASETNQVLCVSFNPEHEPFTIDRGDINKLYVVKGAVEKSMM
ncbi:MAG: S24 family peptidase [Bacteroidales bacterium]